MQRYIQDRYKNMNIGTAVGILFEVTVIIMILAVAIGSFLFD